MTLFPLLLLILEMTILYFVVIIDNNKSQNTRIWKLGQDEATTMNAFVNKVF